MLANIIKAQSITQASHEIKVVINWIGQQNEEISNKMTFTITNIDYFSPSFE